MLHLNFNLYKFKRLHLILIKKNSILDKNIKLKKFEMLIKKSQKG